MMQSRVRDPSTVIIISVLIAWFVTAMWVSRTDGPDWFDNEFLPHVNALLVGAIAGALAGLAAAALVLRPRRPRR